MTTRKIKKIETECDGIMLQVIYNETTDLHPTYYIEGHGMHPINDSTIEQEIIRVHLIIGGEIINILPMLTANQCKHLVLQLPV